MDLGRIGIWTNALDAQPVSLAQEAAAELEELGFGALWYPESVQREAMPTPIPRWHGESPVGFTERCLALENYTNNLRRLGFGDEDLAGAGSDRLVDAVVAWGGIDQVAARVQAHLDAGANHVCIQSLEADPRALPTRSWRALAEALL